MTISSTPSTILPAVLEKASDGLTVKQAADRLGVSTQTIHNWIRTGQLPATKFGQRILRIDPQDLDRMRHQA